MAGADSSIAGENGAKKRQPYGLAQTEFLLRERTMNAEMERVK